MSCVATWPHSVNWSCHIPCMWATIFWKWLEDVGLRSLEKEKKNSIVPVMYPQQSWWSRRHLQTTVSSRRSALGADTSQPKESNTASFPELWFIHKGKSKLWIVKHESDIHLRTINRSNYTSIYVDGQKKPEGSENVFQLLVFDLLNYVADPRSS